MWNTSVNRKKSIAQRNMTRAIFGFLRANPPRGLTLPFAIRVKVCIEIVSPLDEPEVKLCDKPCSEPDSNGTANLHKLIIAGRKNNSRVLGRIILAAKLPRRISNDEREEGDNKGEDAPVVIGPVSPFKLVIDSCS